MMITLKQKSKMKNKIKRKSFYDTIVDELRRQMEEVKDNGHYPEGEGKSAAYYALSNAIGTINTEYDARKLGLDGFSKIIKKKTAK